jgi:phosphatidylglycerol:prolipoprotein diacylglycerol transferase
MPLASRPGMVSAPRVFAIYVHDLDPIALQIGKLPLRWYGLAYLLAFVAGFLLLRSLARRKLWVLAPEKTADFIAAAALFGVFLGGRLGWVLLYFKEGLFNPLWVEKLLERSGEIFRISLFNPEWVSGIAADPLLPFRVWQGGMASHGGIAGLMIFTWFYAKKHKVTWTGLGDGLCVVAPLGLMFGRAANFINGELYGRVANGVAWAVKFPLSLVEEPQEVQSAPSLRTRNPSTSSSPQRVRIPRSRRPSESSSSRAIPRRFTRGCWKGWRFSSSFTSSG